MQISGATALVTGGASGLGEATVRRLVAEGAHVVVTDRDAERGRKLCIELGATAEFVAADVTDATELAAAVATAHERGPLRIAVCCAGLARVARTLDRDGCPHDLDLFAATVTVNLIGTFNTARLAAAAMAGSDPTAESGERGVIVTTASVAAYDGQAGQTAYAASKAGVAGLTLPLARDLAPVGIRAVSVAPGVFQTPMLGTLSEAARAAIAASVPFPKRVGDPADYADLVVHLVENPYLNGETVRLDGGLRLAAK